MSRLRVVKGHGTGNDFIIVPDLDGRLELSAELVRALCDRRFGIGADGVLRVVRSDRDPDAAPMAADAALFMDYRNADGSVAEMCGNGIRVLVRYLQGQRLAGERVEVATRGGVRLAWTSGEHIAVEMGTPQVLGAGPRVAVPPHLTRAESTAVRLPNPHLVVAMPSDTALLALDLTTPPRVEPPLPDGQNVEFVLRTGERTIRMRVHERGVGETSSCGTGICAAVVAAAVGDGASGGDDSAWQVDVPGGTCWVTWRSDGAVVLTGPAVLVAEIELDASWLESAGR
ncbi:MAG: diaminopimelate epimerase [Actinomycetota bacterium]